MPGKRKPLPTGFWDAKAAAQYYKKRGVPLSASGMKLRLFEGQIPGVAQEVERPRRLIAPIESIKKIAEKEKKVYNLVQQGQLIPISKLATNLNLTKRSLYDRRVIKRICYFDRVYVTRQEYERVIGEHQKRKTIIGLSELADLLGTSKQRVRRLINARIIPAQVKTVGKDNKGRSLAIYEIKRSDYIVHSNDWRAAIGMPPIEKRRPVARFREPAVPAIAEVPKGSRQLIKRIHLIDRKIAKRDIAWLKETAQQLHNTISMLNDRIERLDRVRIAVRGQAVEQMVSKEELRLIEKINPLAELRNYFETILFELRKELRRMPPQ